MKRWIFRLTPVLLIEIALVTLWIRGATWAMAIDLDFHGRTFHLGSGRGIVLFQTEPRSGPAFKIEKVGNPHNSGQHWRPFVATEAGRWECGVPYWILVLIAALPLAPYLKFGQQLLRRNMR